MAACPGGRPAPRATCWRRRTGPRRRPAWRRSTRCGRQPTAPSGRAAPGRARCRRRCRATGLPSSRGSAGRGSLSVRPLSSHTCMRESLTLWTWNAPHRRVSVVFLHHQQRRRFGLHSSSCAGRQPLSSVENACRNGVRRQSRWPRNRTLQLMSNSLPSGSFIPTA
jgi:hypothetical protein